MHSLFDEVRVFFVCIMMESDGSLQGVADETQRKLMESAVKEKEYKERVKQLESEMMAMNGALGGKMMKFCNKFAELEDENDRLRHLIVSKSPKQETSNGNRIRRMSSSFIKLLSNRR